MRTKKKKKVVNGKAGDPTPAGVLARAAAGEGRRR